MAASFAQVADLRDRGLPVNDEALAEQALMDASDLLRAEIGWQVYPPAVVTEILPRGPRGVRTLAAPPVGPVVETVAADGTRTVTYTAGLTVVPRELVRWTCVLAAQILADLAEEGSLGGGKPSSQALAEYRISYSDRQQLGELPIPPRVLERLRSTYGRGAYVTA